MAIPEARAQTSKRLWKLRMSDNEFNGILHSTHRDSIVAIDPLWQARHEGEVMLK